MRGQRNRVLDALTCHLTMAERGIRKTARLMLRSSDEASGSIEDHQRVWSRTPILQTFQASRRRAIPSGLSHWTAHWTCHARFGESDAVTTTPSTEQALPNLSVPLGSTAADLRRLSEAVFEGVQLVTQRHWQRVADLGEPLFDQRDLSLPLFDIHVERSFDVFTRGVQV